VVHLFARPPKVQPRPRFNAQASRAGSLLVESLEDRVIPSATVLHEAINTVDSNNDGTVDSITRATALFDNHGHNLTDLQAIDADANGTVDFTVSDTRSFNSRGNLDDWELVSHDQLGDLIFSEARSSDVHDNLLSLMNRKTKEGSIALVDVDGKNYRPLSLPPGHWNLDVFDWTVLAPGIKAQALAEAPSVRHDPTSALSRYRSVLKELEKVSDTYSNLSQKGKSDEERNRIKVERNSKVKPYLNQLMEIADTADDEAVVINALSKLARSSQYGSEHEYARAINRLAERYASNQRLGYDAPGLVGGGVSLSGERLLRAVVEKNTSRQPRGLACLALGRYLRDQSDRARSIQTEPKQDRLWEDMLLAQGWTKEEFTRFSQRDPNALLKEAEAAFERCIEEFGDTQNGNVAKEARSALYEIRELVPGKRCPEISGTDLDGQPLRLNEFGGKVILIDFWTTMCGGCRVFNDYEKELLGRMQRKPIVALGVNCDWAEDKENARKYVKDEKLTWRSWSDTGEDHGRGPIAEKFNVSGWPTVYVIDHHGVIRYKGDSPGKTKLDSIINPLVKAAEDEVAASKENSRR
jgi:thiol-disulfide isomerase/thioredoxin